MDRDAVLLSTYPTRDSGLTYTYVCGENFIASCRIVLGYVIGGRPAANLDSP